MPHQLLLKYFRAPKLVGSVVPSSPALARAMSQHAQGYESILELGAGTGPITRQLVKDHKNASLTVFELDSGLAGALALQHPQAAVWDGCLHDRAVEILKQPARSVAVSSLPFRSLPCNVLRPTVNLIHAFLEAHPERKLVQFTYGMRVPFEVDDCRFRWTRKSRVWANFPPANIWTLEQTR